MVAFMLIPKIDRQLGICQWVNSRTNETSAE